MRSEWRTIVRKVVRTATMLTLLVACHRNESAPQTAVSARPIPRDAARFSISLTSDTTVVFRPLEARWLRVGMRGHAVDPSQRDALIARLTIVSVDTGTVIAKITGQVSQVSSNHVVLMVHPTTAWWGDRRFWAGIGAGLLAGFGVGAATR